MPGRASWETFVPGEEDLRDGEIRVTVLGSGTPWVTRAQASGSILIEVGNPERDLLLFDLGSGSLANFAGLRLPVNRLDKVFLTHLHADHTADLITLFGSYRKNGRADRALEVWGPSGGEPRLGTRRFAEAIEAACAWDTEAGRGRCSEESTRLIAHEFDFRETRTVYERNGVTITSFPVVHGLDGPVGYRLDFGGLTIVHSGDTRPCWPLVRACEGGVDLLVHDCLPPPRVLAAQLGLSLERATMVVNAGHTSPAGAGKVLGLVKPRLGALWHTLVTPEITPLVLAEVRRMYDGPVVQAEDLTVFNVTDEAVVVRQAEVVSHSHPVRGEPRAPVAASELPAPEWWADALIPIDDVPAGT